MPNSKVTKVAFQREWQNPNFKSTIYYFEIEFEDGTKGEFSTNKRDQNKFLVGESYNYVIELKKSEKKGEYKFITKPKEQVSEAKAPGKSWKRDPAVRKVIISQSCQNSARQAIKLTIETYPELKTAEKVDVVAINAMATKFYDWIKSRASDNEQMEIICQSQLSTAIECIVFKKMEIKGSDAILKLAEEFVHQVLTRASVTFKQDDSEEV